MSSGADGINEDSKAWKGKAGQGKERQGKGRQGKGRQGRAANIPEKTMSQHTWQIETQEKKILTRSEKKSIR